MVRSATLVQGAGFDPVAGSINNRRLFRSRSLFPGRLPTFDAYCDRIHCGVIICHTISFLLDQSLSLCRLASDNAGCAALPRTYPPKWNHSSTSRLTTFPLETQQRSRKACDRLKGYWPRYAWWDQDQRRIREVLRRSLRKIPGFEH